MQQEINQIYQLLQNNGISPEQLSEKIFEENKNNIDYWNFIIKEHQLKDSSLELYINYCNENNQPINWNCISKNQSLSLEFIRKYAEYLNWDWISQEQFMTFEFIIELRNKINWELLPFNEEIQFLLNDTFVDLFEAQPLWKNIGLMENVSIEFIMNNFDKITPEAWNIIFENKNINLDIIDKVIQRIYSNNNIPSSLWDSISQNINLDKDIIEKFKDYLNWDTLSINYNFDLDSIFYYKNYININKLSRNDCLTLDMIKELEAKENDFKGSIDWEYISEYGDIDLEFMKSSNNIIKSIAKNNDNLI